MWVWSARVADELYADGAVQELVVVLPPGSRAARERKFAVPARFVDGGATRSESVMNALRETEADFVMIHDAARPFLPVGICRELIGAVERGDGAGAAPLLESVDSLKSIEGGIHAVPREKIFRTQTPQAFDRRALISVMSGCPGATDEATLWLNAGRELVGVAGSEKNFKITTNFDWALAHALAESSVERRVGMGYDVHELTPGRRLVLGGVEVASSLGLLGHSDADIICHAVADALLGAAGRGDIGTMFPASDESYRDADSMALLGRVLELTSRDGWMAVNIDVTLRAQIPRLGDKITMITKNVKELITTICPCAIINIKVKSGEHVGSVGRGECMECHAVAAIERRAWGGDE
jgi:2-C-methyl-D-erythritol 4-phosphate cytidylyltransferase/2-C-methyl-D-erythritol 2,4-cyclodiphosphate synthase